MSKPAISKATVIHWSLYALVMLMLGGLAAGGYFIHQKLSAYATSVDHMKIDSDINEAGIVNALKLRRVLNDNKDNVARAQAIVADTKYYEYQDQIVRDVSAYASAANLTVTGFDFSTSAAKTGAANATGGLKTVMATISLKSPVPYSNYLRFLKLIERNLTKMQVTQLDITNDLKVAGTVSSPVITIEVYVR